VLLLQADHHPTKGLPNKVDNELRAGVAIGDALILEEVISEPSTSFKGEVLAEGESVVTVEQDLGNLLTVR
jgi:hypothetical protein